MAVCRHPYDGPGQRFCRMEVGVKLGFNNVFQSYLRAREEASRDI